MRAAVDPPGRWWHVGDVPGVDGLHLECEVRGGRVVVVGLYVHGSELTPDGLQRLPLGRALALLDRDLTADGVAIPVDDPDPTISFLRSQVPKPSRRAPRRSAAYLNDLRSGGLTERFYTAIARAYREASAETRAPAKLIADEMGVPVKTVHRWIREARLAGKLPPARKGAVG